MKKLKIFTLFLAITTAIAGITVQAQTTDSAGNNATTSTPASAPDPSTSSTTSASTTATTSNVVTEPAKDTIPYTWIIIGAVALAAVGGGIVAASRKNKVEGETQVRQTTTTTTYRTDETKPRP